MSWSSKSLPWLIPSLMLAAPKRSAVVVVSPWVQDVDVEVSNWQGSAKLSGTVPLTAVVRWLAEERENNFVFYVRADQLGPPMNYRLAEVHRELINFADFRGVPDLHAKMLVTDHVLLETSANMLDRSLYRNVESVTIGPNPRGNAMTYVRDFFIRHGLLVS